MSGTAGGPPGLWAEEMHDGILRIGFRLESVLFSGTSEHQRIDVLETRGFGRMLLNDGVVMLSERDEHIYHEMISHVPLFVHPGAKRVLVIGGGDGGSAREALRHLAVERCDLVEIDPMVIDVSRKYFPWTEAVLNDPRVTVTIGDGVRFVEETGATYDVVLVDSTDPVGPARPLFGKDFYRGVRRVLGPGGIVVSQAQSPHHAPGAQRALAAALREVFPRVHIYNYANMTYPGGLWSFTFATAAGLCPVGDLDRARVRAAGLEFRYYSPAVHRAAFSLPAAQARALTGVLTPVQGAGD